MNRSNFCSLASLLLGCICAYGMLSFGVNHVEEINLEEFALGAETTSFFPVHDGFPIHISKREEVPQWIAGWESRGERTVVLWVGNSQLHAINQASADARPASIRVFSSLTKDDVDVLTWSVPNANPQEHFLIFESVRSMLPIQQFVLPVVFDDFREVAVRSVLHPLMNESATELALKKTEIGRKILEENKTASNDSGTDSTEQEPSLSLQQRSEAALGSWVRDRSRLYAERTRLRGEMFISIYKYRNWLFGIDSQTVRKQIPAAYKLNRDALVALLESAAANNIKVLVYVAPLRSDITTPYDPTEYADFKSDMAKCVASHGAHFADLDSLVPGECWGQMDDIQGNGSGYDFMHFQEAGHELLSGQIGELVSQGISEKDGKP
ncbi:hypothetical protein Poly51_53210 [Rubripirellula tenax]|uniref:Uncharacterized protein n=1 Tax=Rubripirellula tenax TaxID=2528015 RepID=A0A5C6EIQ1_9BACT|nr:hypothetical protein [Rubripirellula tenax]TWU47521.1 hypothetical protein Poly51_53210 [Rubripirellula tenax]